MPTSTLRAMKRMSGEVQVRVMFDKSRAPQGLCACNCMAIFTCLPKYMRLYGSDVVEGTLRVP